MPPILSVQQFVTLVNDTLAMIPQGAFAIEGEVAEYKVAQSKWITFTLKDEEADVRLPCFATIFKGLPELTDGMRVRVTGYASVFPRFGKFSLTVESAEPVGEGALQKAYLLLKEKLTKEGVFDVDRKRPLPLFPERIGLITSREAAAFGDFLRIAQNRGSMMEIVHAHVHVQGQNAVEDIVQAFLRMNALPKEKRPEVLVLTRGGGSMEDLQAFNDERVVRAIFASRIPVVVGVGHERDETLADFVADVRASTPSNAAERVVPSRTELLGDLDRLTAFMHTRLVRDIAAYRARLERAVTVFDHAFLMLHERIHTFVTRIRERMDRALRESARAIDEHLRYLSGVSPTAILARGYALVRAQGGGLLRNKEEVARAELFFVHFAQGSIAARTIESSPAQEKLL